MNKRINWKNLSLLVIDFILVSYLVVMLTNVISGNFIGVVGLVKMVIAAIFAEPLTEGLITILNK